MDRTELNRAIQAVYDCRARIHHTASPQELSREWGRWVAAWYGVQKVIAAYSKGRSKLIGMPQRMARAREADMTMLWLWYAGEAQATDPAKVPWRAGDEGLQFAVRVLPDGRRIGLPGLMQPTSVVDAGTMFVDQFIQDVLPTG